MLGKTAVLFFPHTLETQMGFCVSSGLRRQVMVNVSTTRGHIQEAGGADVRRGWRGAAV